MMKKTLCIEKIIFFRVIRKIMRKQKTSNRIESFFFFFFVKSLYEWLNIQGAQLKFSLKFERWMKSLSAICMKVLFDPQRLREGPIHSHGGLVSSSNSSFLPFASQSHSLVSHIGHFFLLPLGLRKRRKHI